MSDHKAEVFKIESIEKHPNADTLSIVKFHNFECIIKTDNFKVGDLAVYVQPDSLVDLSREEFAFLAKWGPRIRSQKLRGVRSTGLILKAPPNFKVGDDCAEYFGITHYNPPEPVEQNEVGSKQKRWFTKWSHKLLGKFKPPKFQGPYYDIENWLRYPHVFKEGEEVEITEKIHGMNARYTYQFNWGFGKFHCCSRRFWRKDTKYCPYWKILRENKWLQRLLKRNPNYIVYGEIYGNGIQKEIDYNTDPVFRIFDIYDPERDYWLDYGEICDLVHDSIMNLSWWDKLRGHKIENKIWPIVPNIYFGPYREDIVRKLIEGKTLASGSTKIQDINKTKDDIREGIVIKAHPNRYEDHFGRAILKAVNPEYLER